MYKNIVQHLFGKAGIGFDGYHDYDIEVKNDLFYKAVATKASLGFGESYGKGWWECRRTDLLVEKLIRSGVDQSWIVQLLDLPFRLKARMIDLQSEKRRIRIAKEHYDLPYEFYSKMLGTEGVYTSALFEPEEREKCEMVVLEKAQERKLQRVVEWLGLTEKDSVLDVGCGYGGLLRHIHKTTGAQVTGLSNSIGHIETARMLSQKAGIPIAFIHDDYTKMKGRYSAVTSVEMIESVGARHLMEYFALLHEVTSGGAKLYLQAIVADRQEYEGNRFLDKVIFPGASMNSPKMLARASKPFFRLVREEDITAHYIPTLRHWDHHLLKTWKGGGYEQLGYPATFFRHKHIYLEGFSCGAFLAGKNRVIQQLYERKI